MEESDAERFERIYRSTYAALAAYARRRLPPAEVDDVLADLYLMVWRKLDAVPQSPLPWLYRSAWLEISSAHRAADRAPITSDSTDGDVDSAHPDHSDATAERVMVAAAMDRLSAQDAEILRLRYWEDLGSASLGTALGCSAVTARVRLHRARARLAALLDPPAEAPPPKTAENASPEHLDWSRR